MSLENSRLLLNMGDVARAKRPKKQKKKNLRKQRLLRLGASVTT